MKHILAIAALLAWAAIAPIAGNAGGLPVIVAQPQNQMAVAGSDVTFAVSASGDNLDYQWHYGTNAISGATNASLTLTNISASQGNYYFSVLVTNLAGATNSSNAMLTVLTVLNGPVNPYAPGTLGYDLFQGTYSLAGVTNRSAYYDPHIANLGTNSDVWTWPVNLSCVGHASDGYQSVLITSNKLLTCAHFGGEAGQTVTFHDTNGVAWVGVVTNVVYVIADMVVAELSNSAPPSIVLPAILPPDYYNYIAGHSLLGMPAFWLHDNQYHIDYAPVVDVEDANWYGYGTWMQLYHDGHGLYSGTAATGGDSGSPAFMSLNNNPVLLFATTLTPDSAGMFISGDTNWNALVALGLTNGMNILDLSGYPLQSPLPPAPDYDYLVPPANQLAAPGDLVTFAVNLSAFGASRFTYQWQCNATNLPAATNATLTVQAWSTNAGNYSVTVSNNLGSLITGATLAVGSGPPVQILAPTVTYGQFQFGFNTFSNCVYTVQYEDAPASGAWNTLTNFAGTGWYWQAPLLPLVTQRFYRVSSQ